MESVTTISAEQIELFESPSIASQLPVVFNTGFSFTEARTRCCSCQVEFPEEKFNGKVLRQTPHVAEVFALGHCVGCNLFSEVRFRMYDDKRFTILQKNGWHESQMKTDSERGTSFYHRIKRAVRWLFTF